MDFVGLFTMISTIYFQYNQWVCIATEGGAQGVPAEGAAAPAQGEVTVGVPPAAGLLRGAVPREGPLPH